LEIASLTRQSSQRNAKGVQTVCALEDALLRTSGATCGIWNATAGQPDLDRSVETFCACLSYFSPKASVFFVQNQPITPRAGTFASFSNIKLGRRLADDAQQGAWGGCGVVTCGRRPIQKNANEKARGGLLRAGF